MLLVLMLFVSGFEYPFFESLAALRSYMSSFTQLPIYLSTSNIIINKSSPDKYCISHLLVLFHEPRIIKAQRF
jgi:hypothetical protein